MSPIPDSGTKNTLALILCPIILFIEGKDEIYFFLALLRHMSPKATVEINEQYSQWIVRNVLSGIDVELREVGGKDQFPRRLALLLNNPNFADQVKGYIIVRDADASAEDTLKSIQNLLKRHGQPCPANHGEFASNATGTLKTGIFIMPGTHSPTGMLEDLCLLSVNSHPIMPHVTDYMGKVKATMGAKSPKNPSKAAVQVFLAGQHECVSSLGLAAQRHYWSFDDTAFVELCGFLTQFLSS